VDISLYCPAFGTHELEPGLNQIFSVTTSSEESQSEGEVYERDHTHRQS
jgi:hypothetical protein